MKEAVIQVSRLISFLAFVVIFIVGFPFGQPFSMDIFWPILLKAAVGSALFLIGGIIIGDIIVKGVVDDIDNDKLEPLEGGLVQQIHDVKRKQRVSIVEREIEIKNPSNKKQK